MTEEIFYTFTKDDKFESISNGWGKQGVKLYRKKFYAEKFLLKENKLSCSPSKLKLVKVKLITIEGE